MDGPGVNGWSDALKYQCIPLFPDIPASYDRDLHEDIPAWVQHLEQGGHAYSCPLKVYGPKWHNLSSSGCQISILRVCGPK